MTRILYLLNSFAMILLVSIACSAQNQSFDKAGPKREALYEISILNLDYALVSYTFEVDDSPSLLIDLRCEAGEERLARNT